MKGPFIYEEYALTPADTYSAGLTCSYFYLPISFAGSVNASLQKPPALLG